MWNAIRIGVLAAGLGLLVLAYFGWMAGDPPAWTLFAGRMDTIVTLAEPRDEPNADGAIRHLPHVEVAWPPGTESSVVLLGLVRRNDPFHLHTAEEIVRKHPEGSAITVRVADGRPLADRLDFGDLANAIGPSIAGVILTLAGLFMFSARLRSEAEPGG